VLSAIAVKTLPKIQLQLYKLVTGLECSKTERTSPKVEALNIQHKVEKSTTTRENRVYFVFFRREEAKGRSKF